MEQKTGRIVTIAPLVEVTIDCKVAQKNGVRQKAKRLFTPEETALLSAWRWKMVALFGTLSALILGTLVGRFLFS